MDNSSATRDGGWSDERVALLKHLWQQGYSASQIVAELRGGVTRNAVLGKLHRLGALREIKRAEKPVTVARVSNTRAERIAAAGGGRSNALPPQKVATIIRLRKAGAPLREISQTAGVSVMSVVRQVRKAGLPVAAAPPPRPKAAPSERPAPLPEPVTYADGEGVELLDLTAFSCRYPLGPMMARAERYCGAPHRPGSPYCSHHHAICYTPAPKRVKAKRPVAVRGFNFAVAAE